jgi:hypothetical protein
VAGHDSRSAGSEEGQHAAIRAVVQRCDHPAGQCDDADHQVNLVRMGKLLKRSTRSAGARKVVEEVKAARRHGWLEEYESAWTNVL